MRICFPFVSSMAVLAVIGGGVGFAQSPMKTGTALSLRYDGWETSSALERSNSLPVSESLLAMPSQLQPVADARVARFQPQESFSDTLPELPANNLSASANGGAPSLPPLPDIQSMTGGGRDGYSNSLTGRAAQVPMSQVLPPANGETSIYSGSPNNYGTPASIQPNAPATNQELSRERPLPAATVSYQQNQAAPRSGGANGELRAMNQGQLAPNSSPTSGRANPQEFATGLPYVTPPPNPRTGRYPTSPYSGPRGQQTSYQQTGYQQPSRLAAQTVAMQTGGLIAPGPTASGAPQPNGLPQNQPSIGIYQSGAQACAPGSANFPATGAVPGTYVPPTYPPNTAPALYSPNNSGYSPLFSMGQDNYNVQLGRGIVGQPTAYVNGQPVRNFLRYIFP